MLVQRPNAQLRIYFAGVGVRSEVEFDEDEDAEMSDSGGESEESEGGMGELEDKTALMRYTSSLGALVRSLLRGSRDIVEDGEDDVRVMDRTSTSD